MPGLSVYMKVEPKISDVEERYMDFFFYKGKSSFSTESFQASSPSLRRFSSPLERGK